MILKEYYAMKPIGNFSCYNDVVMSNYIFTDVTKIGRGGDSSAVDRRASDRKVTNPWCNSRIGSASLCCRERHLTLISHSGPAVNN